MSVRIETNSFTGPAYLDQTTPIIITTGLTTVNHFQLFVSVRGANLSTAVFRWTRNSPAAGQVSINMDQRYYEALLSIEGMAGLPAGVTEQFTAGQTYDNESAHTHNMDHNHAAVTSGANNLTGGGTTLDAVGSPNIESHTHSFDPPNFVGNTGPGSAHTHTFDNIYQHQHSATNTETDRTTAQTVAINLSGATFFYRATE
jgi:hypothetical protein